MNKCRCCFNIIKEPLFSAELIKKNVNYFECNNCGYVQTEQPYWLKEAYTSAINHSDTGIMSRNLSNVSLVIATLTMMKMRSSLVVDYAGGHGFLVRLLRDFGINALWSDPYCDNLVARGFEYKNEGHAKLITAFETFEHFTNPCDEISKMLDIAPNILLTTSIIPDPAPKPSDWWYYGQEHGQHIGFYRLRTLQYLANKFGLYLISDGTSRHFFSKQKYSYYAWRILIKAADKFPKILRIGMRSKTWEDHLLISRNKDNFNL
ncbi:class I SAM-dependent methyltransferase [Candidatus Pelagibacter ubique]|nr:class I SAM-dependent methyltransferase [Candidatus Pelagibacter ubique]